MIANESLRYHVNQYELDNKATEALNEKQVKF